MNIHKIGIQSVKQKHHESVHTVPKDVAKMSNIKQDTIEVKAYKQSKSVHELVKMQVGEMKETYSERTLLEIKAKIQNGSYRINMEELADEMIEHATLLQGDAYDI